MTRRRSGMGLMIAGLIVALVGLAAVASVALHLSPQWTPVLVGAALFLAGALRWALHGEGNAADPGRR